MDIDRTVCELEYALTHWPTFMWTAQAKQLVADALEALKSQRYELVAEELEQ